MQQIIDLPFRHRCRRCGTQQAEIDHHPADTERVLRCLGCHALIWDDGNVLDMVELRELRDNRLAHTDERTQS